MNRARSKHLSVRSIIIIPLVSMAVTTLLLSVFLDKPRPQSIKKVDNPATSLSVKDKVPTSFGLPVRLTIPTINVDAAIEQMGLTPEGDMDAPKTDEGVGWYKYGTKPGDEGSAVVAGHLGLDGKAVFGQLSTLKKFDVITITDEHSQVISFAVTETRRYSYDAAPKEVFTSTSGAHLNLITCDGAWDTGQNTYADRLVVFAVKL